MISNQEWPRPAQAPSYSEAGQLWVPLRHVPGHGPQRAWPGVVPLDLPRPSGYWPCLGLLCSVATIVWSPRPVFHFSVPVQRRVSWPRLPVPVDFPRVPGAPHLHWQQCRGPGQGTGVEQGGGLRQGLQPKALSSWPRAPGQGLGQAPRQGPGQGPRLGPLLGEKSGQMLVM